MKFLKTLVFAAVAAMLISCGEKEQPQTATFTLVITSMKAPGTGLNDSAINFISTTSWTASCDASWVTLGATSGAGKVGSQFVSIKVAKNEGDARTARVTFKSGAPDAVFTIEQESGKDGDALTIVEFLKKPTSATEWYKLKGEIASIASYDYGNFYLVDDIGYVYVYGLTSTQQSKNDQSFATLGLKPGDIVTMTTHRSSYNGVEQAGGTVPAYYETHVSGKGQFSGRKEAVASAKWMELPETKADDGQDLLCQFYYTEKFRGQRSYSSYWDYDNLVATWCAYPLTKNNIGSGRRSDAYAFNPLIDPSQQPDICKNSYSAGNGGAYVRGHQVPSADRYFPRENLEVFFNTNIAPENSDLNTGIWSKLEGRIRDIWLKRCDTLYMVTGVDVKGSTTYVFDNVGKKVTVPVGFFKVFLAYSAKDGYRGYAAYYENRKYDGTISLRTTCISIDSLETKLGIDFFVNLPGAVGADKAAEIEAKDPKTLEWWWAD